MSAPFYYSERFLGYALSDTHPLKPIRYQRTYDLLRSYGIFEPARASLGAALVEPVLADLELVRRAHCDSYLDAIRRLSEDPSDRSARRFGLGPGDTPAFPGMWESSLLYTGASVCGGEHILVPTSGTHEVHQRAHNIAGGLHHAMPDRASGFCVLNDAAVAIHRMLDTLDRVAYIDVDAHHGDGVEAIFYEDPRVLTISTHESGQWLFPGTGHPYDTGRGAGKGAAVNLPFAPYTGDDVYLKAFFEVIPRALEAFRPQAIVTQFGADAHIADPLAHLALTTRSYEELLAYFDGLGLPWLALGGGGYNVDTVSRVWALVYARLIGIELPDELPEAYRAAYGGSERLRDPEIPPSLHARSEAFYAEDFAAKTVAEVYEHHGWERT